MDREQVYQELRIDHWEHVYNWDDVEARIDIAAWRAGCSVEELRQIMREIEKKHPKPRKWRNVEFTKPCRTCGKLIGFARTDAGNLMPVNLNDHTTHWACEKPVKRKRKG